MFVPAQKAHFFETVRLSCHISDMSSSVWTASARTPLLSMYSVGLGPFLALKVFKDEPAAAIPTAIYTFGCMFTGTILARMWAEFGRKNKADGAPR